MKKKNLSKANKFLQKKIVDLDRLFFHKIYFLDINCRI